MSELQKHDNEFAEYSGFWSNKCVSGGVDWQELKRALSLKSLTGLLMQIACVMFTNIKISKLRLQDDVTGSGRSPATDLKPFLGLKPMEIRPWQCGKMDFV